MNMRNPIKMKQGTHGNYGKRSTSLSIPIDKRQAIKVRVTAFMNTGEIGIYIKHIEQTGTAIQLDKNGAVIAITHSGTRAEAYARLKAALHPTPPAVAEPSIKRSAAKNR